jgi:hypothetical protein
VLLLGMESQPERDEGCDTGDDRTWQTDTGTPIEKATGSQRGEKTRGERGHPAREGRGGDRFRIVQEGRPTLSLNNSASALMKLALDSRDQFDRGQFMLHARFRSNRKRLHRFAESLNFAFHPNDLGPGYS